MIPRVSVVIPVYNLGAFLPAAVDSVLAQTDQDFEIVIIDDGSTDPETIRAVDRYMGADRIRVLRTPNRGLANARNGAITAASGAYILPLDADDLLAPQFLERTVPVLDREQAIGFVYTAVRVFGEYEAEWPAEPFDIRTLLARNLGHATALFRKHVWERVGGYDPAFHEGFEDWDFWIRVAAAGWPGRALGEPLVSYRRRPGSMLRRCEQPSVRPRLIRLLIERNRAIYERHFTDVVVNLSQQVFANQEAEREARFALHRVYRSRLGRLAGWAWAVRHDPRGRCAALRRRMLGRPVEMP
jgi:glycosyltransferase involved in cell wall biosynthesis